jgi:hypothetical protein
LNTYDNTVQPSRFLILTGPQGSFRGRVEKEPDRFRRIGHPLNDRRRQAHAMCDFPEKLICA